MGETSKDKKQCAYCENGDGSEDKEHIPPKSLYKPLPQNLITVPSCRACNKGFQKDDDYFRLVMASRGEANEQDSATQPMQAAIRGLNKERAIGFAKMVASQMDRKEVVSPGGIHLGMQTIMNADGERIHATVERIGRGLYFHECGNRIPDTHEIEVLLLQEQMLKGNAPLKQIVSLFKTEDFVEIGDGVFSYSFLPSGGDPERCDAWILEFYKTTCFLVTVFPSPSSELR